MCPPDHLQAQFGFAGKRALGGQPDGVAPLGIRRAEPLLWQKQFPIDQHPRPRRRMRIGQTDRRDTQLDFAQAPVVLAARARALFARRFVRTLIQDQHAAVLQRRMRGDLGLNLVTNRLLGPGRIRHELLQRLAITTMQTPLDVGKIAPIFHGQLTAPVPISVFTRVARARPEARPKALPKAAQVIAQTSHRLQRQSPAIWVKPIAISGGN